MASLGAPAVVDAQAANQFEEAWVQQALAASLQDQAAAGGQLPPEASLAAFGPQANDDEAQDLAAALAASAAEAQQQEKAEDDALEQALRESGSRAAEEGSRGLRPLIGSKGPFYPAGLNNSGNSCFWNAMLQALFAATPIFRGALFQLDFTEGKGKADDPSTVLGLLRDLFAEMDMGLSGSIDAGELYRKIFQRAEEADVSEQMHKLFDLCSHGPGPLRAVCRELFSGDLYEQLQKGSVRRVPLDFCQLDLCVTVPAPLESLLEEHTRDVQGSIERRSYRLPPVLWINLDRFVYDREAQRGKKRDVRLSFPEVLNAWMLAPQEAEWVKQLQHNARQREVLLEELRANRAAVAQQSDGDAACAEEALLTLVERQEALLVELQELDALMEQKGSEQELLYQLQAVIVHRGKVDTGHYYAYARSPAPDSSDWAYLNDATVEICSLQEMYQICEGGSTSSSDAVAAEPCKDSAGPESAAKAARLAKAPVARGAAASGVAVKREGKRGHFWNSMTSMLGCLPRTVTSDSLEGEVTPERYPAAVSSSSGAKASASTAKPDFSPSGSSPASSPGPLPEAQLTAARCLVYVRKGANPWALVDEVRQRVPATLQERIDGRNVELLRQSAEKVAEDFAQCVRRLQSAHASVEEGEQPPDETKHQEALLAAEQIRAEGGMGRARIFLLRACWLARVPWLPDELCPTTTGPPDFRMHYGSTAKKLLLDALIKFGQHDVASVIVAGTPGRDSFVPKEMQDWFATHGF